MLIFAYRRLKIQKINVNSFTAHPKLLALHKMNGMRIGIVGCGNLGMALLKGIHEHNNNIQLMGSKRSIEGLPDLGPNVQFTKDNTELIKHSDILILALKPYTILNFLEEHSAHLRPDQHTVVSAATGVMLEAMAEKIGNDIGMYRAMPNTAAMVNESVTMISGNVDPLNRREEVVNLFSHLGTTLHIDESLMDSATILGACGVAYVLRFMRAMIQGGIEVGFDSETATKIVSQTMKGAAELIIQSGNHPEAEIDRVTTPKGCTIRGLNEMEHAGFSSALIKGIVSSYEQIEK